MGKAKIRSFFEKNKGDLFINSPHKFFKQLNAQGVILPSLYCIPYRHNKSR